MDTETAAGVLRQARGLARLTQRALAARAHEHQPNIATIESGARDANFAKVAHLVRAAGARLCVLPTTVQPVAEVADEIARLLEVGDERRAYRTWLGLHDDLVRTDPATRVALCVTPPLARDSRYDALLAALVEHDLERDGLPVPRWAMDPNRNAHGWWVEDSPTLHDAIRDATPPAFARHGIWLDARELESV
jgi:transcriptional regulator with XRE-family HTH domain